MSVGITYDGDMADLVLHHGDRYEIAEVRPGLHRTIVRRDYDGTADALTFDPGTATEAVFILGGRGGPVHSPFVHRHIAAVRASTRTGELPR